MSGVHYVLISYRYITIDFRGQICRKAIGWTSTKDEDRKTTPYCKSSTRQFSEEEDNEQFMAASSTVLQVSENEEIQDEMNRGVFCLI